MKTIKSFLLLAVLAVAGFSFACEEHDTACKEKEAKAQAEAQAHSAETTTEEAKKAEAAK